jgi:hypothetical protein
MRFTVGLLLIEGLMAFQQWVPLDRSGGSAPPVTCVHIT